LAYSIWLTINLPVKFRRLGKLNRFGIKPKTFAINNSNLSGLTCRLIVIWGVFAVVISACNPAQVDTPRLATQTAQARATTTPLATPFLLEAPGASEVAESSSELSPQLSPREVRSITFWANESSSEHENALKEIVDGFSQDSGIQVELTLVSNESLPDFVQTAVISGTLPDIILYPSEFTSGWIEQGILDPSAATEAIDLLGPETFNTSALQQLIIDSDKLAYAAVPSDLWRLLIIYREDLFEENELQTPDSFQTILAAAEALYDPEQNRYGLVVPTDAATPSTQRLFEFIALANGCQLVDQTGEITFLHPACLEALEYYRALINQYSPIGLQTEISAINAYLAGRTGLIIASSGVLPAIAGLESEHLPTCPACVTSQYLTDNSGIVFDIKGSGEFSATNSLSAMTALGITKEADRRASIEFADYWFNNGYAKWLSVNPERKIPLRHSQIGRSQYYIEEWKNSPIKNSQFTLEELFGKEFVDSLVKGTGNDSRWGIPFGQGDILSTLYEQLILSPLLQEMLSGYFSSSQTVIEIYRAIIEEIPDYPFLLQSEPSATPTP
jgi:multiple sugar transport system substrate-binding protein